MAVSKKVFINVGKIKGKIKAASYTTQQLAFLFANMFCNKADTNDWLVVQ